MAHEGLIAHRPLFPFFLAQVANRSTEMVSPMLLGHAPKLPERLLDPFGQCLEGFSTAETHCLDIGVRQDRMEEQMREGLSSKRHSKIFHMGKIGLHPLPRRVNLFKDDLLFRAMQRFPFPDVTLERAHLGLPIPSRVLRTQ